MFDVGTAAHQALLSGAAPECLEQLDVELERAQLPGGVSDCGRQLPLVGARALHLLRGLSNFGVRALHLAVQRVRESTHPRPLATQRAPLVLQLLCLCFVCNMAHMLNT